MPYTNELNKAIQDLNKATGLQLQLADGQDEDTVLQQVKSLTSAYREKYHKIHFLKSLLVGDISASDVSQRSHKFFIDAHEPRYLILIEMRKKEQDTVIEVLKNIYTSRSKVFLIPVTESHIAILHPAKKLEQEQAMEQMCKLIIQTLGSEAYVSVTVSYSERLESLELMPEAFRQCAFALRVGKLFYSDQTIFSYVSLGVGRLIYELPRTVCDDFLYEVYGSELPTTDDEESMNVVAQFIRNNLNIAETARQLHMHRNTLIYRLEQIQKRTGLDLRIFEDAMTYHIATMVLNYVKSQDK